MVTRQEAIEAATQGQIADDLNSIAGRLGKISESLIQLTRVATERGIHEGFLDRDVEDALAEEERG